GVDHAEDVGRVVTDRAQYGERSSRDEHKDEGVLDQRLAFLIRPQEGEGAQNAWGHRWASLLFDVVPLLNTSGVCRGETPGRVGCCSPFVSAARATLRLIGGSEQALGR